MELALSVSEHFRLRSSFSALLPNSSQLTGSLLILCQQTSAHGFLLPFLPDSSAHGSLPDSCRKLPSSRFAPVLRTTLAVILPLLAELFGSRFTSRFFPNTSAHGHFFRFCRTLRLTVHCPILHTSAHGYFPLLAETSAHGSLPPFCRPLRLTVSAIHVPQCTRLPALALPPFSPAFSCYAPDCPGGAPYPKILGKTMSTGGP
ncbi:hypothetical protein OUZ56_024208 [Daphnia magna]|uniref:Uncharacterized protein n=1 Tax=Daphnia magna TaxID=35525 RepID=A0ABR0B0M5_9CRUS|nr:hypothetical protein OUZ56_024208 [Daphnia magna]